MKTPTQPRPLGPAVVILAILVMIALAAVPIALVPGSEFGGSDGAGSDLVAELAPDYDSGWISNIWAPPGGETESMLFALQAVAGGILIGYLFGYKRAQQEFRKQG